MANRNLKARYRTVGPKREVVHFRQYHVDENGSLQYEEKEEEMDCYYVYFPHGHSIRVTSFERLKELGYHIKPRIVDMDTGDLIDIGGDPYDFAANEGLGGQDIVLSEEGDLAKQPKKRTADANV